MASSSAMSSGVSFTDKAPMFWLRFSILVVPGMGQTSSPWWWTHARASCAGVQLLLVAIAWTFSKTILLCSRFSSLNLGRLCDHSKYQQTEHSKSNIELYSNKLEQRSESIVYLPFEDHRAQDSQQVWFLMPRNPFLEDYKLQFQSQVP